MAKLELEVGGKYTAAQVFDQWDKDLKETGKSTKEMGKAAKGVASEVAGAFGDKLNPAAGQALSTFERMAEGGIWAAVGTLAGAAINYVSQKLNEAAERAKKFTELMRNDLAEAFRTAFSDGGENLKGVSDEISRATQKATEMASVLRGDIAAKAKSDIAELHIETLNRLAGEISESGKAVILAEEAYQKATIQSTAAVEQARANRNLANERVDLAMQKRDAAEKALADAQQTRAGMSKAYADVEKRRNELQAQLNLFLSAEAKDEQEKRAYAQRAVQLRLELEEFETQHKDAIAVLASSEKVLTERETALADATQAVESAQAMRQAAERDLGVAQTEAKSLQLEANIALQRATAERENDLLLQKEATEAAVLANAKLAKLEEGLAKVREICTKRGLEEAEYVKLYTKAIEEGCTHQDAMNKLAEKYNQSMEERNKQIEAENKGKGKGGKTSKADLVEAIRKGIGGTTVNTSVNTGDVGKGVDQSDEVITLAGLQREVRDAEADQRDYMDAVDQSSAAMLAYMQGRMSDKVADAFVKKLADAKWTIADVERMAERALKSQMLSTREQREQQKAVVEIKDKLKELGLK